MILLSYRTPATAAKVRRELRDAVIYCLANTQRFLKIDPCEPHFLMDNLRRQVAKKVDHDSPVDSATIDDYYPNIPFNEYNVLLHQSNRLEVDNSEPVGFVKLDLGYNSNLYADDILREIAGEKTKLLTALQAMSNTSGLVVNPLPQVLLKSQCKMDFSNVKYTVHEYLDIGRLFIIIPLPATLLEVAKTYLHKDYVGDGVAIVEDGLTPEECEYRA